MAAAVGKDVPHARLTGGAIGALSRDPRALWIVESSSDSFQARTGSVEADEAGWNQCDSVPAAAWAAISSISRRPYADEGPDAPSSPPYLRCQQ